jgi:hypothetical protein
MRKEKDLLNLECVLTDSERLAYSKELADSIGKKHRSEDGLKSFMAQAKAEISGFDASINLLSEKLSTGREYRKVECRVEWNFERKTKRWTRVDTFEVCKEDLMSEKECQEEMDI